MEKNGKTNKAFVLPTTTVLLCHSVDNQKIQCRWLSPHVMTLEMLKYTCYNYSNIALQCTILALEYPHLLGISYKFRSSDQQIEKNKGAKAGQRAWTSNELHISCSLLQQTTICDLLPPPAAFHYLEDTVVSNTKINLMTQIPPCAAWRGTLWGEPKKSRKARAKAHWVN